ncbi:MAG: PolC-type DNA polymerase III [Ktedonobacteraceae bacterium]
MDLKEQVLTAAETLLQETPSGLTIEALTRQVAKQVKRQLPSTQVDALLRTQPQRFIINESGRWQLRAQHQPLFADDTAEAMEGTAQPETVGLPTRFRRGYYVVFDLEATSPDTQSPATEIIQIAAQRWIDGMPQEPWATFVQPSVPIPQHIMDLTQITMEEVHDAPPIDEALRDFFAYVGDLPLIAHNGASYDGPLLIETCKRIGLTPPNTFFVLDTLPLARALLPHVTSHRVGDLAVYFDCARPDAHRADADVVMLSGIVRGLEKEMQHSLSGAAVYELLRRAGDPWVALLTPPDFPCNCSASLPLWDKSLKGVECKERIW